MPKPIEAIEFLAHPGKYPAAAVCVAFGDEAFLQRQVVVELRNAVLGDEGDGDFSLTTFDGDDANLRDVLDELSTVALFGGGKRLVVIEDADAFVTRHLFRLPQKNQKV